MCQKFPGNPGLCHCQTCQPLWGRPGEQPAGCLPRGLPHRPDLGLRRDHRLQPAAGCHHQRGHSGTAICRTDHRSRHCRRCAEDPGHQTQCASTGLWPADCRSADRTRLPAGHRRPAVAGPGYRHGQHRGTAGSEPPRTHCNGAGRSVVRLENRQVCQIQCHRLCP